MSRITSRCWRLLKIRVRNSVTITCSEFSLPALQRPKYSETSSRNLHAVKPLHPNLRSYSTATKSTCWKCFAQIPTTTPHFPPVCPSCSSLQEVDTQKLDYFTLLTNKSAENSTYRIDQSTITKRAKDLQRLLHPDLYSNREERERTLSAEYSSLVNHALSTLLDPIARGLYLYEKNYGSAFDMEAQLTMDGEFLGDVMELNEKLLELSSKGEWTEFRDGNRRELERLERNLATAFSQRDPARVKRILSKMKYYENLQSKLKEQQFKLGIVE